MGCWKHVCDSHGYILDNFEIAWMVVTMFALNLYCYSVLPIHLGFESVQKNKHLY